ncbi:hypothetical protein KIL84_014676 [Mauremys mutica]|uniref:Uncharacterized protein n=1 Tax=Mauremys mutica TaxID=74926 RepID=A0A9D3XRS8_9SAUR|nr:hypothetical protein KIL84_014676 [Mauremys mutica]
MVQQEPECLLSSSLDVAVSSTPPSLLDDYRQFQELLHRVSGALNIPLQKVQDKQHQLLDILHTLVPVRVALPINKAILQLA